jgi:hypothetical protein
MFVSQEIVDAVKYPFPENWDGHRLALFRETLDHFTLNGEIAIAENPRRKPSWAYLARMEPEGTEIWDIRCIDPRPGIRAFGGFSELDTFVALTWDYRENLETEEDWNAAIAQCRRAWDELFHPEPPFRGASLNEYLSDNYRAV